ncbi:hypothetical protein HZB00_04320 [Candidatus Woesearchaeota archaeon]|nr:hypothetical protein [Candidatus Woesearchaeota archaeon]
MYFFSPQQENFLQHELSSQVSLMVVLASAAPIREVYWAYDDEKNKLVTVFIQ